MKFPSGETYEGYWKDDKRYGKGKATWLNGQIFYGDYRNDKLEGLGTMMFPSGRKYEGEWKDGKQNGHGKMIWSDGQIYDGNWCNDVIEG